LLEQAIGNLLDNAIDFAPEHSRILFQAVTGDGESRVSITDQGPGIPDYARERLFERFFSMPRPHSQKRSTGLGLSFVKEVLDLHKGSVCFRNAEGGGTVAEIRLPSSATE